MKLAQLVKMAILFATVFGLDGYAQKKTLDIEACMSWKRIDTPAISPTGRWVTYRVSLMESTSENKDAKMLHLFDTRTRKEILLPGVTEVSFYNNDQSLYYVDIDSTGTEKTI